MDKLEEKYRNNPTFNHLVQVFVKLQRDLQLTPDEIREAALYAAMIYAYENPSTIMVTNDLLYKYGVEIE